MIETVRVELKQERIWQYTEIVYKQVPAWFGHITRPLKLGMLKAETEKEQPRPVLLWLCGGAWIDVNKDVWMPELVPFAKEGFAVVSVEYRLSHEAKFPAQIEDVKAAIRYLRAHAEQYNIDPNRIAIMGESAGGYLSILAGTTGNTDRFDVGDNLDFSSTVQAVVDWYGPVDFLAFDTFSKEKGRGDSVISPEAILLGYNTALEHETAVAACPLSYLSENTPPFLILHGTEDNVVPIEQSMSLYEELRAKGIDVTFLQIEGAGHATDHFVQSELIERILQFLKSHL